MFVGEGNGVGWRLGGRWIAVVPVVSLVLVFCVLLGLRTLPGKAQLSDAAVLVLSAEIRDPSNPLDSRLPTQPPNQVDPQTSIPTVPMPVTEAPTESPPEIIEVPVSQTRPDPPDSWIDEDIPSAPEWEDPQFFPQLPGGEFAPDTIKDTQCMNLVRGWLRRSDHWDTDAIGWSERTYISAELIYTDGNHNVWLQQYVGRHSRGQDIRAIVMRAARNLRKPTIFLMNLNDVDLWMITNSSSSRRRRADLLDILRQCPHLFLLHWNPSIDLSTGRLLGPRTVPIPDFHRSTDNLWDPRPPKNPANDGKVAYRGATLGFWLEGDYRNHDRFIAVEALHGEAWADVAFNVYGQGVSKKMAPWIAEGLNFEQMSSYSAVLDLDGNANSWEGLRWKLGMGNAVFKAQSTTGFIQWYYPHLVNNLHLYVFDPREDPKVWKQEMQAILNTSVPIEERRSTKLADAGRAFAKEHLTMKAMDNYLSSTIQSLYELYSPDCVFDPKDSKHTRCWEKRDWRIQGTEGMNLQWYPGRMSNRGSVPLLDGMRLEFQLVSDDRITLLWAGSRSVLFTPWFGSHSNTLRRGWVLRSVPSNVEGDAPRWNLIPLGDEKRCMTVHRKGSERLLITAPCDPIRRLVAQSFVFEPRCGYYAIRSLLENKFLHAQVEPDLPIVPFRIGVGYLPLDTPPQGDNCDLARQTHLLSLSSPR